MNKNKKEMNYCILFENSNNLGKILYINKRYIIYIIVINHNLQKYEIYLLIELLIKNDSFKK